MSVTLPLLNHLALSYICENLKESLRIDKGLISNSKSFTIANLQIIPYALECVFKRIPVDFSISLMPLPWNCCALLWATYPPINRELLMDCPKPSVYYELAAPALLKVV